jgi:hypothetical protein
MRSESENKVWNREDDIVRLQVGFQDMSERNVYAYIVVSHVSFKFSVVELGSL